MRHPTVRQGSVFTPIIIFCFCILVVGVLVAPSLALDFVFRSGALKYAVLGLPDQCPSLSRSVDRANKSEQIELLGQVLDAAFLKERDPYAIKLNRFAIATFEVKPATPPLVLECIADLISRFPNSTGLLLDFLENKYATLSLARSTPLTLYPAVVSACKKSPTCAKEIEVRYRNTKNSQTQEGLRLFLSDVGPSAATALLTIVAETPNLGFGKSDSLGPLNDEITRLLEVAVTDETRRLAWLLFVQDKTQKPILRWRVARIMRQAQILSQDGWPIMLELLQLPSLPIAERWSLYAEEIQNWPSTPQVLSAIATDINAESSTAWTPASKDKVNAVLRVLDSLKQAPPGEISEVATAGLTEFSRSIDQWVLKLVTSFGSSHPLAQRLPEALANQKSFKYPLPAFIALLANPATAELGLRLLIIEESPSAETQTAFKTFLSNPKTASHEAIVVKVAASNETSGIRLLGLANGLEGKRRLALQKKIQAAQAGAISRMETEIASGKLAAVDQAHRLSILVNVKPLPAYAKKLNSLLAENFTCDPTWTKPAGSIIMSGANHPVFLTALFKMISCPQDLVDVKPYAATVNTTEARKKIQPYLNTKLTQSQLDRLSEVFQMANRIPGSALPPKIKQSK